VFNEKAVMHLRNIQPREYVGGWNSEFIRSTDVDALFAMDERDRPSIISVMLPVTENVHQYPISFVPLMQASQSNGLADVRLFGNHSMSLFYARLYNLEDSTQYLGSQDRWDNEYKQPLTTASLGKHYVYSANTKTFSKLIEGDGHLSGNRTGRGAAAVWFGNSMIFPDQNTKQYSF
jgi:hypothetical protein